MSVNSYDNQTKTLTSVAGGTRVWIGTDSAHTSAVSGGTMPNNCMVYITDDTSDQISDTPTQGSTLPISSGGVYNALHNQMVVEQYTVNKTMGSGQDVAFSFSGTKAGYTPICWNLYHGYSTVIMSGVENATTSSGSFTIAGFARNWGDGSLEVQFKLRVVWLKNI